jgi:uncharacterized protein (TIGR00645 family)
MDTQDPAPFRPAPRGVETALERTLFAVRWLMVPMYLGLVLALVLLTAVFLRKLVGAVPAVLAGGTADDAIVVILSLIDLTLVANLILIVLFSGYENFVSRIDLPGGGYRPDWMGKVDYAGVKMKLVGSIVAISAIQLLKVFMEIGRAEAIAPADGDRLFWMTAVHLTFVFSGLLLAVMDYLGTRSGGKS